MAKGERKEKLSIYLVKGDLAQDGGAIKLEKAQAPIALDLGEGEARLYVKREVVRSPPPWSELFSSLPEVPPDAFGRPNSVGAVLLFKLDRTFLLSFGHGFHLINGDAVERDFGLRVTLNSVEPGKLRSLDKASYDHNPLNSRTQSSKELDIFDLDMDSESELLHAVTGASKEPLFGSQITGRDALTLMVETDARGLARILRRALEKYLSKLPQEFEWVDNLTRVRDPTELEILDLLLNDVLARPDGETVWLGEPEIVDWEGMNGYSFDLRPRTPRKHVLELEDLRHHLSKQGEQLTVDALKRQVVHINDANFGPAKTWTAYRCLYAELSSGNEAFVLRDANWYRVKTSFVERVDRVLADIGQSQISFPIYAHKDEGAYNASVASSDATFHLMDKKNVRIGNPHDKIEFCDLIKDGSFFVHVKYYRSSSTLSHLFAQGNVAAETFVREEEFRAKVNSKLPEPIRLADARARPDASRFTVVYAIATTKSLPEELPFFSKVTLRNAISMLRALNFNVQIARIPVDPELRLRGICEPH